VPAPLKHATAPCVLLHQISSLYQVTGHLSEGSFVRNVVVQIPKYDAKPNPNHSPNLNPNSNPNCNLVLTLTQKKL